MSKPPTASMQEAAVQTAKMISITSIGGAVGKTPKTTAKTIKPRPPQKPRANPPCRTTMKIARNTIASSIKVTIFVEAIEKTCFSSVG